MATKGWAAFIVLMTASVTSAASSHEQPFPFSHKSHAGDLKQECTSCHAIPDPGKMAGMPTAASCMQCHATIKSGNPAFHKLAAYAKSNKPVPWVRLYSIPDFVIFNHRAHVNGGATCEDCHGKVTAADFLTVAPDFTQAHCLNCHKASKVSTDCSFCHDLK